MSKPGSLVRLFVQGLLSAVAVLLMLLRPCAAQRALPDPALLPGSNPLCDGIAVRCLDMDDLAGHANVNLQVLPRTDRRDTAAVVPFGVALGLFGRFAGGISTHYAFWKEGDAAYQQLGPLRLDLSARLFPLLSAGGGPQSNESGQTHYAPPRGLQLGLSYQHEVRVWKFEGANSLGLLTDLASLRLVGSRMFGPIHLSASLGALYDWHGQFATSEAAAHLGLYLPGFQALKVYVEAMGRGVPAHVQMGALLPGPDGQDPIHPQGVVGLGLSFHPHARVDLGVSVHRGFGGLAPWAVTVQFLTLSAGKTYEGRAATPVAKMAADVATEAAVALKEFIDKLPIDPTLDEDCQILDYDNATVLGQFGKRTKSGFYCEQDGFQVPIRHELLRDKKNTKLCRDDELKDCLLERRGKQWVPVHRPRLDGACRMTDSDGLVLGFLGEPTADGKRCRYQGARENGRYGKYTESQELPIGALFHTDADRTAVCVDEAMQHCFMRPPVGRHTLAWGDDARASTALLGGIGAGFVEQAKDAQAKATGVAKAAEDVATGKVKLNTVYEEAKQAATGVVTGAVELIQDPEKRTAATNAARATVDQLEKSIEDWRKKPPEEQMEDGLRGGGRLLSHGATGVLLGGGTRAALEGVGLASTALKGAEAEAAIAKAAKAADHAGHAVADAAKVKKTAAQTAHVTQSEAKRAAHEAKSRINLEARSAAPRHTPIGPNGKPIDTPRTVFRRETPDGRVTHYQTFEVPSSPADPRPVVLTKRFDGVGDAHGGVATPHIHAPSKPGKGLDLARPPHHDELPKGFK